MLKQRVITALILLAILLPALFYPASTVPFAVLMLIFMAAGAWEWGRLNGFGQAGALGLGALCTALCAGSWWAGWLQQSLTTVWIVAGCCWVLGGVLLLRAGVVGWPHIPAAVRLIGGVLALWLAWMAVVQARNIGINFLLSVLVLVWVADILPISRAEPSASNSPGTNWRPPSAPARAGKVSGAEWPVWWCWRWSGAGRIVTMAPACQVSIRCCSRTEHGSCCWLQCLWLR